MARETSTNLEKEGDNDSGKPLQILSAVQTEFCQQRQIYQSLSSNTFFLPADLRYAAKVLNLRQAEKPYILLCVWGQFVGEWSQEFPRYFPISDLELLMIT